jgi:hypothetical protein
MTTKTPLTLEQAVAIMARSAYKMAGFSKVSAKAMQSFTEMSRNMQRGFIEPVAGFNTYLMVGHVSDKEDELMLVRAETYEAAATKFTDWLLAGSVDADVVMGAECPEVFIIVDMRLSDALVSNLIE